MTLLYRNGWAMLLHNRQGSLGISWAGSLCCYCWPAALDPFPCGHLQDAALRQQERVSDAGGYAGRHHLGADRRGGCVALSSGSGRGGRGDRLPDLRRERPPPSTSTAWSATTFLRSGGQTVGDIQVNLLPKGERKRQSHAIAKDLRPKLPPLAQELGAVVQVAEIPPDLPCCKPWSPKFTVPPPRSPGPGQQVKKLYEQTEGRGGCRLVRGGRPASAGPRCGSPAGGLVGSQQQHHRGNAGPGGGWTADRPAPPSLLARGRAHCGAPPARPAGPGQRSAQSADSLSQRGSSGASPGSLVKPDQ